MFGWSAIIAKKIRLRYIIQLLVIEGALAYFFLHSASGLSVIKHVAGFFDTLLAYAAQGSEFVFGWSAIIAKK
ncbi:hypothetical protein CQA18_25345, partial [Enterobacter hormaechei]